MFWPSGPNWANTKIFWIKIFCLALTVSQDLINDQCNHFHLWRNSVNTRGFEAQVLQYGFFFDGCQTQEPIGVELDTFSMSTSNQHFPPQHHFHLFFHFSFQEKPLSKSMLEIVFICQPPFLWVAHRHQMCHRLMMYCKPLEESWLSQCYIAFTVTGNMPVKSDKQYL